MNEVYFTKTVMLGPSFNLFGIRLDFATFFALLILSLVILVPPFYGSIDASKALAVILGGGALLCTLAFATKSSGAHVSRALAIGLGSLGILVFLSTFLSAAPIASFFGTAVLDQGSGIFLLSLLVAIAAGAAFFRKEDARALLLQTLFLLGGIACLFTTLDALLFHIWFYDGKTLLGNVRTLEMFAWLGVLSFSLLPLDRILTNLRPSFFLSAVSCGLFLALYGEKDFLTYTALILVGIIFVRSFMVERSLFGSKGRILICFLLFLFVAFSVRFSYPSFFSFPPEVRPSLDLTIEVLQGAYTEAQSFLFGRGPAHFSTAWEFSRNDALNRSPLWEETFQAGFNTYLTRSVEMGGLFMFLSSLSFLLAVGMFYRRNTSQEKIFFVALLLYGALWFFAFVPRSAAEFTFALLVGSLLGGALPEAGQGLLSLRSKVTLLALGGTSFLLIGILYLTAYLFYASGVNAYSRGHIEKEIAYMKRASSLVPSSFFAVSLARAYQGVADTAVKIDTSSQEEIARSLIDASESADRAVALNQTSLSAFILKGDIGTMRVLLGDISAIAPAKAAYNEAAALSPHHPVPLARSAQLAFSVGDMNGAETFARGALVRKPGYEPALEIMSMLDIQEGRK